jgi:hypothetical protein
MNSDDNRPSNRKDCYVVNLKSIIIKMAVKASLQYP